jgi:AraC-like DNA-binding protein
MAGRPEDRGAAGVLYTEHADLRGLAPVASLWSYDTHVRERGRASVTTNASGSVEFWLDRSDPLLNTMLPGTHVSLVLNLGDEWSAGRSLVAAELLPPAAVVGPATQSRILRVGRFVRALGCVIAPALARAVLGVPASELTGRVVPLWELWPADEVDRLLECARRLDARRALALVRDTVVRRVDVRCSADGVGDAAAGLITARGGQVSVAALARAHGLSARQFARRFTRAAGLPPKLFARVSRFQRLVHALLSADVARWASVSTAAGFYDQSHMINEFRAFAGSPPTTFFRPHGEVAPARVRVRGRPSEWLLPPDAP